MKRYKHILSKNDSPNDNLESEFKKDTDDFNIKERKEFLQPVFTSQSALASFISYMYGYRWIHMLKYPKDLIPVFILTLIWIFIFDSILIWIMYLYSLRMIFVLKKC
jgi:hypothetical protein